MTPFRCYDHAFNITRKPPEGQRNYVGGFPGSRILCESVGDAACRHVLPRPVFARFDLSQYVDFIVTRQSLGVIFWEIEWKASGI